MAITAAMVKELRDKTGAGMMDCKKALTANDGDMDAAVEFLRKNGAVKAEKKAGRIAAEGVSTTLVENNRAAIVEVNSETDFVSKNEKFQNFVAEVAKQVLDGNEEDMDSFLAGAWNGDRSKTVKDVLTEQIAVIGENLSIRRFHRMSVENGMIVSYIHGGGRIAVLVKAETENTGDEVREALKNVAMQIAAMSPRYIKDSEVPADELAHEEEILRAQIENDPKESQKPEKVREGILKGRLKKELKEICLLDQVYTRAEDGKQTVGKYLEEVGKKVGSSINVTEFIRYETGEGIEKKEENFAEEVAKQMQ